MKMWVAAALAALICGCTSIQFPPSCFIDPTQSWCPPPGPTCPPVPPSEWCAGCWTNTGPGGKWKQHGGPCPSPTPSCPPGEIWHPRGEPHQTSGCVPDPSPSPIPAPTPSPSPSPISARCPDPIDIKLGFARDPRPLARGFRHLASITPLVRGACAHKGDTSPNAVCAVDEGCADHRGSEYHVRFGQPQAWQSGTGFERAAVERATDGCNRDDGAQLACGYNLTFATNHPDDWVNGLFRWAGEMEVCVSMPNLPKWRCQRGQMGADGLMRGFATNDSGYDRPKP